MASKEQTLLTSVMIREHTRFGNGLATFLHEAHLFRYFTQTADNLFVSIVEREDRVRDTSITTEFKNEFLCATKVMAGNARVEVVDGLELQASMEEIEPSWAVDIHSGAKHFLRERLANSEVSG